METKTRGRCVRPEDYDRLIEFYEGIIANKAASLRMRLTAAKQLDAILTRMECREAAEARRAERTRLETARAQQQAIEREQKPAPEEVEVSEAERVRVQALNHLQKILRKS